MSYLQNKKMTLITKNLVFRVGSLIDSLAFIKLTNIFKNFSEMISINTVSNCQSE